MILILAGTGEARRFAGFCAKAKISAMASLAGATKNPIVPSIKTVSGGFGGEQGFKDFLNAEGVTAILDATHPFAANITARTWKVAQSVGMPLLRFERAPWAPGPGHQWINIDTESEAVRHVRPGGIVFLATGRQTLHRFSNLSGRKIYCRQIDPPEQDFPFAGGAFVIGRPPFSVEDEVALFQKLKVDYLIVKNAGGEASFSKLEAARKLGMPVLMIKRPPTSGAPMTDNAQDVEKWLRAHG